MEHHLTVGAHLLLWVFPLVVVAIIVLHTVFESRSESGS
jgi:cytochrome c-type biogenesis protein CcmH/NrfF